MLGIGESDDEVLSAMNELRVVGCDILVLGQYLQPTKKQTTVKQYLDLERFIEYAKIADKKGFAKVVSSPLARTSYKAASNADI
jgi:lipoic acid synthetase